MATTVKKTESEDENDVKIIKVKPADHTVIKVKAARKGLSMGKYVGKLARDDK